MRDVSAYARSRCVTFIVVAAVTATVAFAYYSNPPQLHGDTLAQYTTQGRTFNGGHERCAGFIAPTHRSSFDGGRFMRLDGFAQPLAASSKVLIIGGDATVWPKPNWYLCGLFPIGNTVEAVAGSGDAWFFTGSVHCRTDDRR